MGQKNSNNGEGQEKKETITQDKESGGDEIVLKVDMHCEACAKKVVRALTNFQGVEDVAVNRSMNTVVVKGKTADPAKLCQRIRKKSGRNALLLSPLPKPEPEQQPIREDKASPIIVNDGINKDQPPPVKTVVLRVQIHCEACAQILQKRIRKIKGVESVESDAGKDQVTVKGVIADPAALAKYVYKKTRKQAEIIAVNEDEAKKSGSVATDDGKDKPGEVKKESQGDNEQEDSEMTVINQMISRYYDDYHYWLPTSPRYSNMDYNSFNYQQSHVFSDENPNACSII